MAKMAEYHTDHHPRVHLHPVDVHVEARAFTQYWHRSEQAQRDLPTKARHGTTQGQSFDRHIANPLIENELAQRATARMPNKHDIPILSITHEADRRGKIRSEAPHGRKIHAHEERVPAGAVPAVRDCIAWHIMSLREESHPLQPHMR